MGFATKDDIKRLEQKLDMLLGVTGDVPEEEMLRRIQRSKSWAKQARNGTKDRPPIFKKSEWYSLNGRTIFYKQSAIDRVIKSLTTR